MPLSLYFDRDDFLGYVLIQGTELLHPEKRLAELMPHGGLRFEQENDRVQGSLEVVLINGEVPLYVKTI